MLEAMVCTKALPREGYRLAGDQRHQVGRPVVAPNGEDDAKTRRYLLVVEGTRTTHAGLLGTTSSILSSYLMARASLRTATSITDYLGALEDLKTALRGGVDGQAGETKECPLEVPVKWVKNQLPPTERMYQVMRGSWCRRLVHRSERS